MNYKDTINVLKRLTNNFNIHDDIVSQLLQTEWFMELLSEYDAYNQCIGKFRKTLYMENEYLVAHLQPVGNIYTCLDFETIIDYVVDDINICGLFFEVKGTYFQIDKENVFYLYIKKEIILHKEHALDICEEKLHMIGKKQGYCRMWSFLALLKKFFWEKRDQYTFYMANIMEKEGNYADAEKLYIEAVNICPDNYWLYYQLGIFYRRHADIKKEKKIYLAAYKRYRFKEGERTEKEQTIFFVIEALIRISKHNSLKYFTYKKFLDDGKKYYIGEMDKYIYNEMENY